MSKFVKNCWYMAGWSEELGETILSRTLFDRKIAFFRTSDGSVKAVADRCPHRFAPLSMGEVKGDDLVCAYHGLRFDGGGNCVHNPFGKPLPSGARLDSWACVEQDDIIWLWGGDPAAADPSQIPDFEVVRDAVGRKVLRGYTLVKAPYEFCTDNLMDLSHIETVHKGTFAGNGVIYAGELSVIDEGDTLHSNWWMPNVGAPTGTQPRFEEGQLIDHWLDMRWNAPASMQLMLGATLPGKPREEGYDIGGQAHIVTPETATTSHYFTANARHHMIDDAGTDAYLTQLFNTAFNEEDKPIIEASYANMGVDDFWAARPLSTGVDQGGTRARRKIEAMLKAEAAGG